MSDPTKCVSMFLRAPSLCSGARSKATTTSRTATQKLQLQQLPGLQSLLKLRQQPVPPDADIYVHQSQHLCSHEATSGQLTLMQQRHLQAQRARFHLGGDGGRRYVLGWSPREGWHR